MEQQDKKYMIMALEQAQIGGGKGEVPIGAVVVCNDRVIARCHNLTQTLCDPTAHAEMQAITAATSYLGGKYLKGCTLYVTVEPCPMCAAALRWSQLSRLVYGASEPKIGYTTISTKLLHPKTEVLSGVEEEQCGKIMSNFFKKLR